MHWLIERLREPSSAAAGGLLAVAGAAAGTGDYLTAAIVAVFAALAFVFPETATKVRDKIK